METVATPKTASAMDVAILTGGADRPYAFGLATALLAGGSRLDLIAGDELEGPQFRDGSSVRFLNFRGDTRPDVGTVDKIWRVVRYYARLIRYAATAQPRIFHILWNNKFETVDRTLLTAYYRLLGKRIVLTVHNVNAGKRDGTDSWFNRLTLRIQYRLADHIFVHTEKMKSELAEDFGIRDAVTVIPFGINNSVPVTNLSPDEAKRRLGLEPDEPTILFFGNIVPYKGLEYLLEAFQMLVLGNRRYRLVIAGRPRGPHAYWERIQDTLAHHIDPARVIQNITFVSDEDTELYFKAADVLVLPYTEIFQSGVLFLGYSFGLPVIAADVGSMKEDIVEGETGFVFVKKDSADLARVIERYFASELYAGLSERRRGIQERANERHSWDTVSRMTRLVYQNLLRNS